MTDNNSSSNPQPPSWASNSPVSNPSEPNLQSDSSNSNSTAIPANPDLVSQPVKLESNSSTPPLVSPSNPNLIPSSQNISNSIPEITNNFNTTQSVPPSPSFASSDLSPDISAKSDLNFSNSNISTPDFQSPVQPITESNPIPSNLSDSDSSSQYRFTPPTNLPDNPMANLNTAKLEDDDASAAIQNQFNQMDETSNVSEPNSSQPSFVPPPSFTSDNSTSSEDLTTAQSQLNYSKKNHLLKILSIIIILAVLAGLAFLVINFVLPRFQNQDNTKTTTTPKTKEVEQKTLTYWGLWEPESVMRPVFDEFESLHPGLTIKYETQDKDSYRTRLQTAIDTGVGPDIFRMHNSWLPMLKNYIQPDTDRKINLSQFFPVASTDLAIGGVPFAVPLGFDALALFYNPDLFEKAGQQPPKTWDQLIESAKAITTKDEAGNIQIAGVALGDAASIVNFSDILGLMIFQQGGDPARPSSDETRIAIEAYTSFATKSNYKFWSDSLGDSVYAFAQGKVGMIFAPSWRAFEIKEINPTLNFKTTAVPQLGGSKVAWATYWAESVSRESKNSDLAWDLLVFMAKDENLIKLYESQSLLRGFGEIYPKMSLASSLEGSDIVSAFSSQGSYAKSWYLSSRTHDNGLNDNIIKYYEDLINAIISKNSQTDSAFVTAETGVTNTLAKYNIVSNK